MHTGKYTPQVPGRVTVHLRKCFPLPFQVLPHLGLSLSPGSILHTSFLGFSETLCGFLSHPPPWTSHWATPCRALGVMPCASDLLYSKNLFLNQSLGHRIKNLLTKAAVATTHPPSNADDKTSHLLSYLKRTKNLIPSPAEYSIATCWAPAEM